RGRFATIADRPEPAFSAFSPKRSVHTAIESPHSLAAAAITGRRPRGRSSALQSSSIPVTPDADIHARYPQRHQRSARARAFVDFLTTVFAQQARSAKS